MLFFIDDEPADGTDAEVVSFNGVLVWAPPPFIVGRRVEWTRLPATLAAMKYLTAGTGAMVEEATTFFEWTSNAYDDLDCAIGHVCHRDLAGRDLVEHDSDLIDQVDEIIRWGAGLARHCPVESASRDLAVLCQVNDVQLEQIMISALR